MTAGNVDTSIMPDTWSKNYYIIIKITPLFTICKYANKSSRLNLFLQNVGIEKLIFSSHKKFYFHLMNT